MSSDSSSTSGELSVFRRSLNLAGVVLTTVVAFFGAQFVAVTILLTALLFAGISQDSVADKIESNLAANVFLVFAVAIVSIGFITTVLRWQKLEPKKVLLLNKRPTKHMVISMLATYAVYFVSLAVLLAVLQAFTSVNVDQSQELGIDDPSTPVALLLTFFMLVIITPVYEEILFRGYLFNRLKNNIPVVASYVVTSLLFGAAHLEYGNLNWVAAADTLLFSGFLIYLSQKHQSLIPAILLHALKNSIAFYVLFVA